MRGEEEGRHERGKEWLILLAGRNRTQVNTQDYKRLKIERRKMVNYSRRIKSTNYQEEKMLKNKDVPKTTKRRLKELKERTKILTTLV